MVQFNEEKSDERLKRLREKEQEDLASTLADHYGVPYLDLTIIPINIDALRIIKESEARESGMAIFDATDKQIDVALLSPKNEKSIEAVEALKTRGYKPDLFMVSHKSLEKVWDRYKDLSYSMEAKSGALDISSEGIEEVTSKVLALKDVQSLVEEALTMKRAYRISRVLEIIIAGALALKAS